MKEELGDVFPNVSSPSVVSSSLCRGKKKKGDLLYFEANPHHFFATKAN
jgi:hypothetical protein